MPNPFNYGNPVSPDRLVGRWEQIEDVARDLRNLGGHSHMIIGGRRFGKSSFLEALKYHLVKQIDLARPEEWYFIPVLVDLQGLANKSIEGIFSLLLHELHMHFNPQYDMRKLGIHFEVDLEKTKLQYYIQNRQKECSLDEFSQITDDFLRVFSNSSRNLRLLFLIDEIEVSLNKDWTETFFDQLRSLLNASLLKDYIRFVVVGSSQVIDLRANDSPLLDMSKFTYLEALKEKDIQKIIHQVDGISDEVIRAVLDQSGGHPFIAQYLMHHFWELDTSRKTPQGIIEITNKFKYERFADLEKWLMDIGKAGQLVYNFLMESHDWLTGTNLRQLINVPDIEVKRGLVTLCYHGVVIQDGTWTRYHFSGELFKNWFQNNISPSLIFHRNNDHKDPIFISETYRRSVFISYSHKDSKYLEEFRTHLRHYIRVGNLHVWDDTKIPLGSQWKQEVQKALSSAKIAVLLVSADFLASDYIATDVLPQLLTAARQEGAVIICVILKHCPFDNTDLAQFQVMPSSDSSGTLTPLGMMNPARRAKKWQEVADFIGQTLNENK